MAQGEAGRRAPMPERFAGWPLASAVDGGKGLWRSLIRAQAKLTLFVRPSAPAFASRVKTRATSA
jgi:hypothetical protein